MMVFTTEDIVLACIKVNVADWVAKERALLEE